MTWCYLPSMTFPENQTGILRIDICKSSIHVRLESLKVLKILRLFRSVPDENFAFAARNLRIAARARNGNTDKSDRIDGADAIDDFCHQLGHSRFAV